MVLLVVLAACDVPFGIGLPTTRALESGAADQLDAAESFRLAGSYTEAGVPWTIDLEMVKPSTEHILLLSGTVNLEAIIIGGAGYFRGQEFLSSHMGSDALARSRVKAAGNAWWKGLAPSVPKLSDFTDGSVLRTTFLGSVVNTRTDHVSVDGVAAVDMSGPRGDVFISAAAPHQLLRVHLKPGVSIDGVDSADLRYSDFDSNFGIVAPSGAIDFADLSTLPPLYTVLTVETAACAATCVVSAVLKNLGGKRGAKAPSTVTFKITDPETKEVLGTCTVEITPDVAYNVTTRRSCTISGVNGNDHNAAVVTATADNPGRA